MKSLLTPMTIGFALLFFSGCTLFDPDLKTARDLEGDWEVTSFTKDGTETMQVLITSFGIEFEEYDRGNDEGDFTFSLIFTDGSSSTLSGEYLVDDDGSNLELTYTDGTVENWNLDLEKDDLEMSAVLDGFNYNIRADRD